MLDLSGITIRQLQVFLRIAERGTFAAAASDLDIAPPSVSGHVRALEARCGALFARRAGGRVALTMAGELLRRHGTAALAEMQALAEALSTVPAAPGVIRIVAMDYLHSRIRDFAADFLIAHPHVTLRTSVVGAESEGQEALRRGEADLFYVTRLAPHAGDADSLLGPAAAGLYAAPDLVVARGLDRPGAILPMIVSTGEAAGAGVVQQALFHAGVHGFAIAARVQHVQIGRALCLRGQGVALLYDDIAADDVGAGRLVRLPVAIASLWWHCLIAAPPTPDQQRFIDHTRARLGP